MSEKPEVHDDECLCSQCADPETVALVGSVADKNGLVDINNLPTLVGLRLATMLPQEAVKAGQALSADDVLEGCDLGAKLAQKLLDAATAEDSELP